MVREQFPSVQILTVNSHTGQLILGASSPTTLSAQLTEVLYCGGNAQPNSISPVQLRRALAGNDSGTGAFAAWSETRSRCSAFMS